MTSGDRDRVHAPNGGANVIDGRRDPLVSVRDLTVHYPLRRRSWIDRVRGSGARASASGVRANAGVLEAANLEAVNLEAVNLEAVNNVSLDIFPGETLGLVGESGCGKTSLGRAMLGLIPPAHGVVRFCDVDLTTMRPAALRRQRRHMQMIFQHPAASLDPRLTIARIIGEPIASFGRADPADASRRVRELMDTVGLSDRLLHRYPHELSGGQQQRVAIARALAADPAFIVADEPLSALDVSIQAQIINLIRELQRQRTLAFLFISHDLRAVRYVAHRVAVMYLGSIVEIAETARLYERPLMPYTKALLSAMTSPDPSREATRPRIVLNGETPSPFHPPSGCRFHPRCPHVQPVCRTTVPPLIEIEPGHHVACARISPAQPDINL